MASLSIPSKGKPFEQIMAELDRCRANDADWRNARTWSLVYHAGDEVAKVLREAYMMFLTENALNPMAFPSLRKFETEVVAMAADLFHGGAEAAGNMTSGGTESILLAVCSARERARAKGRGRSGMEMLLPLSAHPAFMKAAHYFDLTPVHIPLRDDFRADVDAARKLVNDRTVLMVGSAPNFPYGVIDPIDKLSAIAMERDIPFHVDACVGGFILPFLKEIGYDVSDFDFSLPGVTSISADLHKYGYAAKGSSTIIYRNKEIRKFQYYAWADWPGGIYASPTMTGTRGGGTMAAAWAVMNYLGREGYLRIARATMETAKELIEGINSIPKLFVLGRPDMTLIPFGSNDINIFMVGDFLEGRGWQLDRIQKPPALHLVVTVSHSRVVKDFLTDLAEGAAKIAKAGAAPPEGMAAIYGMIGALPDRAAAQNFILEFLSDIYRYKEE